MGPGILSRSGSRAAAPRAAGFTLIELVVVVAVLSVLAVGAGLVASRSGAAADAGDLNRFRGQFETARARAIQGRQALGFEITARGFQSTRRTAEGWEPGAREQRWRGRVVFLQRSARRLPDAPDIVILPDGRTSAFSLSFSGGSQRGLRCTSDGYSGLICAGDRDRR